MIRSVPSPAVLLHGMATAAGLALLAFWPPERGAMLLIPASGDPVQAINVAVAGHAALMGLGPLPGSIVITGDRALVAARIGRRAMLLTAAPDAGCRTPPIAGQPA